MDEQEWISAVEAAGRLGVDPRQVRRLAAAGEVPAERAPGGAWLVDPRAIASRARRQGPAGRPLSPAAAWQTIGTLSVLTLAGKDRPRRLTEIAAELPAVTRFRIFKRLREATPGRLAAQLRSRAEDHRVWLHASALDALRRDPRVWIGAADAIAAQGGGISAGGLERLYVRERDLPAVLEEYAGHVDPHGQVTVMVVPDEVSEDLLPRQEPYVPEALAWIDVLDDPDPRAAHAASQWLRQVQDQLLEPR
jgi:hypothetical protein